MRCMRCLAVLILLSLLPLVSCAKEDGGSSADSGAKVKPRPEVSPREEFEAVARHLRENGSLSTVVQGNVPFFGERVIPDMQAQFRSSQVPLQQRVNSGVRAARLLLAAGEIDRAITQIDAIFSLIRSLPGDRAPDAGLWKLRGLIFLRQAEVRNCIERHNAECCIFPLQGGAVHEDKAPAQEARLCYLEALKINPRDLAARWLLNLASMAIGDYPQGVPELYRLHPRTFVSDYDVKRFRNVAGTLGVDTFNRCGGVIADDFDGDGVLDIVTSTIDPLGPLTYYRSGGAGGFEDRSDQSNASEQLGGLNCIGADYDNDGDLDVLILRGAWFMDDGQIRNSLLRNDGDGNFTDVTFESGLADNHRPTQAAVWADFDNDGDLDLFVGNESRSYMRERNPRIPAGGDYPSQLYRNNGDGTFTDVAKAAGVTNDRFAKGVTAGDYDNDGDVDLYVSNGLENRLYRNDGDLRFTDVAPELGMQAPTGMSFATWFFDYDNDGWLDLFVAAYDASVADLAADYMGVPHKGTLPVLYHNNGDGTFTDVTAAMDLNHPYLPMGANFGDLDNDGWLDIYLTTGEPQFESLMPNVMLRNDRGATFQDVTSAGGFGHLQKGHGISFSDFDNDGDQDIYHQLGGFYRGDGFHNALFLNPGHRFLTIRLAGETSNTRGVGARIKRGRDHAGRHTRTASSGGLGKQLRWLAASTGNRPRRCHGDRARGCLVACQ